MVEISKVLHHFHLRKRVHENLEKFPSKDPQIKFIDRFIYLIGISGPIMTLPQAWDIWSTQDASGLNIISWSWYLFTAFIWTYYGLIHKEKPLIITNILWIIIHIFIVTGIIVFS